ncbi:c-type cytochrome [Massilia niastensis]|uniref:c-type cytochrome n=1 Tax=Massilia niastensis TaxID=544911 RepID=UPI00037D7D0C|nr:hypothetical protein [Massilia niastensis]
MHANVFAAVLSCLVLMSSAAQAQAPAFRKDVLPLLQRQCVACHTTGEEQGQLGLAPTLAYASLVGKAAVQAPMPRVDPGKPERSYLLHKLRGTHLDNGGSGMRMPMGQEQLGAGELGMLAAWIKAGAPDN